LALKIAKSREIPPKFDLTAVQGQSSKVIDLGVNRNRICDFLLVTNNNFGRISYCFGDIDRMKLTSQKPFGKNFVILS